MTVYLTRVSVTAAVEADCAQDAVNALADTVDKNLNWRSSKMPPRGIEVRTNEDDLSTHVEFCALRPHRCKLPHSARSRRLSRYADAYVAESGTQASLAAPPRDPLEAEAHKAVKLGGRR